MDFLVACIEPPIYSYHSILICHNQESGMDVMRVVALIPAAGMGKRMGASMNKQYLVLSGKAILARTVEVFQASDFVDEIHLVVPEEEIPFCRAEVVDRYGLSKVHSIIPGGSERQYSVLNGLRALSCLEEDAVVMIHDGVRPFITQRHLEQAAETAQLHGAALVAVPAKDTIKTVEAGVVVETPARERLWLAQTPQAFRYGIIRAAHESAAREGFLGTDDASLVERTGARVHVVLGDYRNIKITTPEDMVLAEAFLNTPTDRPIA